MIGVDSNVLVQYLVKDDPSQFERARRFIGARTQGDPVFASIAVIIETIRVLRRHYRMERGDIHRVVLGLLSSRDVVVEAAPALRRALRDADDS